MVSKVFVAKAHEIIYHSTINKTPVSFCAGASVSFSYCPLSTSLLTYTIDSSQTKICGLNSKFGSAFSATGFSCFGLVCICGSRCACLHPCKHACHPCCCFGEAAQRSSQRIRSSSRRHSSQRGGFPAWEHLKHLCFLGDLGDRQKLGKHQNP